MLCNLVVVAGSCILFYKSGHLHLKKFLPFVVTSIPLAFLGASFQLQEHIFFIILALALITSAVALIYQAMALKPNHSLRKYPIYLSYLLGGAIGLLSGLVGIGGGIFLAPVLNHMKWDKPIVIAALASFFILVNSVSGIGGLIWGDSFQIFWPEILGLLFAVLLGGQLGVRISIGKLSAKRIRLLTAFFGIVRWGTGTGQKWTSNKFVLMISYETALQRVLDHSEDYGGRSCTSSISTRANSCGEYCCGQGFSTL